MRRLLPMLGGVLLLAVCSLGRRELTGARHRRAALVAETRIAPAVGAQVRYEIRSVAAPEEPEFDDRYEGPACEHCLQQN